MPAPHRAAGRRATRPRGVYRWEQAAWQHVGDVPLPSGWETSHLLCLGPELYYVTTRASGKTASRLYRVDARGARIVLENDCPLGRLVAKTSGQILVYDSCGTVFESETPRPGG